MEKATEHIHTISRKLRDELGRQFEAHVFGDRRDDGTWAGWIEFREVDQGSIVRRTGQETSQPDRKALDYWAGGLEAIYLEGALSRSHADGG